MANKVAPCVSDADIEANMLVCLKHTEVLNKLHQDDPESYGIAITNIRKMARGEWNGKKPGLKPEMAESILIELGEFMFEGEEWALGARQRTTAVLA